jgi:hypothetical protein
LRDATSEIRAAGAELVVVGNGRPEHAADFRDEQGIDFPLYVDPELGAYAAAGLRRGMLDTLGGGTLQAAWRALRSGARQGATRGDPWQLGGAFVIEPGGRVRFRHVCRDAADHPPLPRILRALARIRA